MTDAAEQYDDQAGGDEGGRAAVDTSEVRTLISDAVAEMQALDAQATQINAQRAEVRARIEEAGINRHAFAAVCRFSKLEEAQRDGFDLSLTIARRAIGAPMQGDLFGSR